VRAIGPRGRHKPRTSFVRAPVCRRWSSARRLAPGRPTNPERSVVPLPTIPTPPTPPPTGPARSFAELGVPWVLTAALAARGVTTPRPIQAHTLPDALAGRDVLGRAETGSGKTLAFGLALLARTATRPGRRQPQGLVLVPTRELADQVHDELLPLAAVLGLRLLAVYGGVPLGRQAQQLQRGIDVVVATPGRLLDLLGRGACSLAAVAIAVLDEADHLADMGFLPAVTSLLDRVPPGGQRLLFSATLDGQVDTLVGRYLTDPARHTVAPSAAGAARTDHQVRAVQATDKVAVAAELAGRPGRTGSTWWCTSTHRPSPRPTCTGRGAPHAPALPAP
jgi:superfamily II DNA/RNA helicase